MLTLMRTCAQMLTLQIEDIAITKLQAAFRGDRARRMIKRKRLIKAAGIAASGPPP